MSLTTGATLPPVRSGRPADDALRARRSAVHGAPAAPGPGVDCAERTLGGVRCLTVAPADPVATVVYLHGGGYRLGTPEAFAAIAGRIARAVPAVVHVVDYRLAPEHPFPAAVHDAVAVYDAVRSDPGTVGRVVLAGDSAGGGLSAATAAFVARTGGRRPDALVLVSPWLDLRCTSGTFTSRAERDVFFGPDSARTAAELYLQGHPADDPVVSPLFADPAGFPPSLLLASSAETLLDDTLEFAARLARADVRVRLEIVPGLAHAWPTTQPDHAETDHTLGAIADFVTGPAVVGPGRPGGHA